MEKIYHIEDTRKIEKIAGYSTIGSYIGWLITIATTSGLYHIPFLIAYTASIVTKEYAKNLTLKTEECKRFRECYKIIMDEFIKMNNRYELKSPLEVWSLFDIVKAADLLSIRNVRQNIITSFDYELIKEQALNGHGVCRHTAMMLDDIYKRLGFEASPMVVAIPKYKEVTTEVEIPDEVKQMMEFMQQTIQIEINGEKISPEEMQIGEAKMMKVEKVAQPITKSQIKHGNHVINRVNFDGLTYTLDSENRNIYVPNGEVNGYFNESGQSIIYSHKGTKKFLSRNNLTEATDYPSLPLVDQIDTIGKTQDRIMDNKELLEEFEKAVTEPLKEAEDLYQLILRKR